MLGIEKTKITSWNLENDKFYLIFKNLHLISDFKKPKIHSGFF